MRSNRKSTFLTSKYAPSYQDYNDGSELPSSEPLRNLVYSDTQDSLKSTSKANEIIQHFVYRTDTGKDLEIEIPSSAAKNKASVNVKSNGQKISEGDLVIYWDDQSQKPLLQYYNHPDGLLILNIRDGRIRVVFSGEDLTVSTNKYRKTTRGICGKNSAEPRDDYQTPNGLVDQPEHYGASFALSDENSDPKTEQLKKQAQEWAYQPKTKYTAILRSDKEWQQAVEKEWQEDSQKAHRAFVWPWSQT